MRSFPLHGSAMPTAFLRGRLRAAVGRVQQVPTGRGESFPSISHNRPSVYQQSADDVSRATTRGMIDAEIARVLHGFDVAKPRNGT